MEMTRKLSIAATEFSASPIIDGDVAVAISFNPRSDELLGLPAEDSETKLAEIFEEEIALLQDACAAGFFASESMFAQVEIGREHSSPDVMRLRARGLDCAGLSAFALMVDRVSQARLGMLEDLGSQRSELEQISSLSIRAGTGVSLDQALERLGSGPGTISASTFLENDPVPLDAFVNAEGEGQRLDMELVFATALDQGSFAQLQKIVAAWERLTLASALNAGISGRDWIVGENDLFGGAQISRGKDNVVFSFFENFHGSPAGALWFADAARRVTGTPFAFYVNLVEEQNFDPKLMMATMAKF